MLECIPHLDFEVDVLHSHDWHTAMVNFLLREKYQDNPLYERIKTVYTIHNLQFQGVFPPEVMYDLLELGDEYFHSETRVLWKRKLYERWYYCFGSNYSGEPDV